MASNHNQRYIGCTITGRAPPGYYLLFLVDQDRVPSMANWIHLTP
jgi:hypothetical protein